MEINLFSNIQEFNPLLVFNKFSENESEINLHQCKLAFYYIFGVKIKKKNILKVILLHKNTHSEMEAKQLYKIYKIKLEEFMQVYNYLKMDESQKSVSNHNLILILYNYLSNQNTNGITLKLFKEKIKEKFPFLTSNYIDDIFLNLDGNEDGKIFIKDIESIFYKTEI